MTFLPADDAARLVLLLLLDTLGERALFIR